jgi:FkbM family methyltransferase
MAFTFRPNTTDEFVYRQVVAANEYNLPRAFRAEDIILDIGAHIGAFSYAAYLRGARHIWAFEANEQNAAVVQANLDEQIKAGHVIITQSAVWRSDMDVGYLMHTGFPIIEVNGENRGINTGGGNVLWDNGAHIEVPAVKFDDIVRLATNNGQDLVRLLKIDAETSEFPILLTSKQLGYVAEIVGEYHEVGGEHDDNIMPPGMQTGALANVSAFTAELLREYLTDHGFEFTEVRFAGNHPSNKGGKSNMGIFHARKRGLVARMVPNATGWYTQSGVKVD